MCTFKANFLNKLKFTYELYIRNVNVHGFIKLKIIKTIILLKVICILNSISINISVISFAEIGKNYKIYVKTQRIKIIGKILNRKRNSGNVTIPDIALPYRAIVTKLE